MRDGRRYVNDLGRSAPPFTLVIERAGVAPSGDHVYLAGTLEAKLVSQTLPGDTLSLAARINAP